MKHYTVIMWLMRLFRSNIDTDAQPVTQPDAQPDAQPVAQPVTQPVAQPVAQPVTQHYRYMSC